MEEKTRKIPWSWPGKPEEVWEYARALSAPFRPLLDRVPEKEWPGINSEVHATVRKYACQDGVHFGAEIVMASGTKA